MHLASILILLCLIFSGCATVSAPDSKAKLPHAIPARPGSMLALGMTRQEIRSLLEQPMPVGEVKDRAGMIKAVRTRGFYTTELLIRGKQAYLVDFYRVDGAGSPDAVKPDLFPVIFQNNILIGKGQDEVDALRRNMSL